MMMTTMELSRFRKEFLEGKDAPVIMAGAS
ncbi:MAG: hypothetical protein K0Q77_2529 [Anaerosporomusa subterranea]|jgi:hypothetical protein|nr:hypothetical protein [Anaerosporomusa subterranea]